MGDVYTGRDIPQHAQADSHCKGADFSRSQVIIGAIVIDKLKCATV